MISIQYFVISLKYSFVTTALSIIIRLRSVSCCRHWSFPIKSLNNQHVHLKVEGLQRCRSQKRPFQGWADQRHGGGACVRHQSKNVNFQSLPTPSCSPSTQSTHLSTSLKPLLDRPVWISIPPYWSYFTCHTSIGATVYIHFPPTQIHPHAFLSFSSHLVRSSVVSIFVF